MLSADLGTLRVRPPRRVVPIDPRRPSLRRLQADLARRIAAFLESRVADVADQIGAALDARGLRKAELSSLELAAIDAIVAAIDFVGWGVLVGDVEEIVADIVKNGSAAAFVQVGIDVEARREIVNVVNSYALEYSRQRSAAMVGMRVDALGTLIPNPRAEWQITEGTRTFLRAAIRSAIDEGWSNARLAENLRESYGFSKNRAMVIARTETNRASNAGALEGYRTSGVVGRKEWLTAEDDKVTPDCVLNGEAGPIPLSATFPSGVQAPPDHPNCRCTISPVVDWDMVDNIPALTTTESKS